MATKRLRKNIPLLKVINTADPKLQKAILKNINGDTLRCICDCCHNLLNGNIHLTPAQRRKLVAHKKLVRTLADIKAPLGQKKRLLQQKGGAIGAVLTPLLAVAASLLVDQLTK